MGSFILNYCLVSDVGRAACSDIHAGRRLFLLHYSRHSTGHSFCSRSQWECVSHLTVRTSGGDSEVAIMSSKADEKLRNAESVEHPGHGRAGPGRYAELHARFP